MTEHGAGTESTSGVRRRNISAELSDTHADAGPVFAHFARPRSAVPTTIAFVSDTHISSENQGTWKVFHRTQARLRTTLADANTRNVDAVVFAGDLTEEGSVPDFEAFDSLLSSLNVPFIAVPGNHRPKVV
ncbi:metallophosphoesterase family protein [Haladaptatus cibarius]|uniref:metallophosphoesterase family protein n=1 Tax=Haladaptatus cibarius TaxID=453847 RepID=UPI000678762C|nr:metallophosphoesterase [Haladaptatus cibarius]